MNEHNQLGEQLSAIVQQLEEEKFAHWQTQQALNTAQQEINELHALNLYDLVGDSDALRSEMVSVIRERDDLREHVRTMRIQLGIEIAKVERARLQLNPIGELLESVKSLVATCRLLDTGYDMHECTQRVIDALDTLITGYESITSGDNPDARLISANLDLLNACKVAKAYIEETAYEYDEDGRPNDVYQQIVAAIAKAEGDIKK